MQRIVLRIEFKVLDVRYVNWTNLEVFVLPIIVCILTMYYKNECNLERCHESIPSARSECLEHPHRKGDDNGSCVFVQMYEENQFTS